MQFFRKTREDLRVFFHYFRKYRKYYLVGITSLVIVDSLEVVPPYLLKLVIDRLTAGQATAAYLAQIVGIYMAVALVQACMRYLWRHYIIRTSMFASNDMRSELFVHLSTLAPGFFRKRRVGDLVSLSTNDIEAMRFALGPGALILVDASFYFLTIPPMMFFLSPKLTVVAMLPLIAVPFLTRKMEHVVEEQFRVVQDRFSLLASHAQEALGGIRVIKGGALEPLKEREFDRLGKSYIEANVAAAKTQALFYVWLEAFVVLATKLVFLVGGAYVIGERISIGVFVAFHKYIQKLSWPMEAFGMAVNIFQRSIASQKRVDEVLRVRPEIVGGTAAAPAGRHIPALEVRGLSFSYPDAQRPAVDGVSFAVRPGQRVGMAGKVGSGKSSLLHCLARREAIPRGTVFLGGIDVLDIPPEYVRSVVGLVPQEGFLFSRSVEDNILYGSRWFQETDKPARRAAAEKYARIAQVHDDVLRLTDGYETRLGERGTNVSGGQRQRLSIARALAAEPQILLMDDCLSAVDTHTESQILGYLEKALADKTAVIITHRIYSMLQFDKIIVLDNHRIAETGTHDELMAAGGYYAEMFEKQSSGEVVD
ncbi:MAG: ABC transporter ATP-binding protein [Bdellovibrionales bacterium]|nr:ABC transporter ATP-binding protein [Bdellovibrionales bacterium]